MNVFKRLFARKNRKSASKDTDSTPKDKSRKVPAIADSNNISSNILDEIYIEDVSVIKFDDSVLAKHHELPLNTSTSGCQSGDSVGSSGTDIIVAAKDSVSSTDITIPSADSVATDVSDDDFLDSDIQILPTITRGMCNINSVSGIEEILNQIIKELNKIIIEREKLKRKLKLKGNSYKIVARKFNTLLNNRAYKPIKMA